MHDAHLLAGDGVPDAGRAVLAAREQAPPVGAEDDAVNDLVVAAQGQDLLAAGGVPQAHGVVLAAARPARAVAAPGDAADVVAGVALQDGRPVLAVDAPPVQALLAPGHE